MGDDWEYSDSSCPKCQSDLATRRCDSCGGEGYTEDEDDEWHDYERCDNCNGQGHETWCRECGWDMNFKCFLNPEYKRAWEEKQAGATVSAHQPRCLHREFSALVYKMKVFFT